MEVGRRNGALTGNAGVVVARLACGNAGPTKLFPFCLRFEADMSGSVLTPNLHETTKWERCQYSTVVIHFRPPVPPFELLHRKDLLHSRVEIATFT